MIQVGGGYKMREIQSLKEKQKRLRLEGWGWK